MVNELTLDEMILSAFAAVAQTNGALFLGAIYNGDEESRVILLQRVREYLINHYGLHNNDLNDNHILTILDTHEDELSAFALNVF